MFYLINGSPRKNRSTATLLNHIADGIRSNYKEAAIIHLCDYDNQGCISCYNCKKKDTPLGKCFVKDELSLLIDRLNDAEGIILSSPIYFNSVTGLLRSFCERFFYCHMCYNSNNWPKPLNIPCGILLTCGMPPSEIQVLEVQAQILSRPLGNLCGTEPTLLTGMNNIIFSNPCNYKASVLELVHDKKLAYADTEFPKECQTAYEYGKKISR